MSKNWRRSVIPVQEGTVKYLKLVSSVRKFRLYGSLCYGIKIQSSNNESFYRPSRYLQVFLRGKSLAKRVKKRTKLLVKEEKRETSSGFDFGLVYKRFLDTLLGSVPIVVARGHHAHLLGPDRRPQREIVQVHVYRKIRIVTGRSQIVAVIVRRGTHIGGGVRRQPGTVRRRGRGVGRGVVRVEVLAPVHARAESARARGAAGSAAHRLLRAPQALGQPGVSSNELPVLFPYLGSF